MKYREEENFRLEWNVPDRFADIVRFGTASVVSSFSFARSLSISLSLSLSLSRPRDTLSWKKKFFYYDNNARYVDPHTR